MANLSFVTLQSLFVYRGLGFNVGLVETFYMSSLGAILTFVNITPDNIGIKEAVYMFTADIVGLDSDIILLGSLIIRAVALINTFVIGGISYLLLTPRIKENGKEFRKDRGK